MCVLMMVMMVSFTTMLPYRYQRVFYPLLSSLLSFGKVRLLPFIMWLINLLAVVGGVYYVVKTARLFGVKKWFLIGGLYAASVGLVMCVLRDLAEPLAILLLLGAIYYYMNRAFCVSALFLAFGVLTKEIGVVVAIVVFLWYVLHEDRRRLKCILCFSLPVFLLVGWHLYIWFRLGVLPYVQGSSNFGLPFNSVGFIVGYMLSGRSLATRVMIDFFFASFLFSLLIGIRLLMKRYISLPLLLLLVFLGIFTLFTPLIWGGNWSYPRVFLYVYALLFIVYFEYKEQLILLPILGMTFLPLIPFAALYR